MISLVFMGSLDIPVVQRVRVVTLFPFKYFLPNSIKILLNTCFLCRYFLKDLIPTIKQFLNQFNYFFLGHPGSCAPGKEFLSQGEVQKVSPNARLAQLSRFLFSEVLFHFSFYFPLWKTSEGECVRKAHMSFYNTEIKAKGTLFFNEGVLLYARLKENDCK